LYRSRYVVVAVSLMTSGFGSVKPALVLMVGVLPTPVGVSTFIAKNSLRSVLAQVCLTNVAAVADCRTVA
jgi:hypothetical protein